MADIVERVRALIARTASTHEEEARTAAMIACRLIREHDLQVDWGSGPVARTRRAQSRRDPVEEQAMREWEERVRREREER